MPKRSREGHSTVNLQLSTGLEFEFRMSHTLYDVCELLCPKLFGESVTDHMWIFSIKGAKHVGPFGHDLSSDGQIPESAGHSTSLGELSLTLGEEIELQYDMGSMNRLSFRVSKLQLEVSPEVWGACPRQVLDANLPGNAQMHQTPEGMPSMDQVFPHLAAMVVGPGRQYVPYMVDSDEEEDDDHGVPSAEAYCTTFWKCAKDTWFAVEGGPNAMADFVYFPNGWESPEQLLCAAEIACDPQTTRSVLSQGIRHDALTVFGFPPVLPAADEAKFQQFMNQPADRWGPEEVKIRPTVEELDAVTAQHGQFNFSVAFPKCAEAYRRKKWIQFSQGQVAICKNNADNNRRPKQGCTLAKHRAEITSLHELFCIAESLL